MSGEIYLIATVTPKKDVYQEVLESLQSLAKAVEKDEPGALIYQVFANKDQGTVVVVEKYKDKAALESHRETQAFKELMDQSVEKLALPPQLISLSDPTGFSRA